MLVWICMELAATGYSCCSQLCCV